MGRSVFWQQREKNLQKDSMWGVWEGEKSRPLACATRWTVEPITGMGETGKRRGPGAENSRLSVVFVVCRERYLQDN